ncbi:MAG TPA: hypothetical protein VL503_09870 [Candidatus Omnitrophota bacterium]|nr:hypothetical protein [Candidatus Omnitrophota bacterium]
MFLTLLLVTLLVALATSGIVVALFRKPIRQILDRIIGPELSHAWQRFLLFAIYVVGVSSGVQIWKLELYIRGEPGPNGGGRPPFALNSESMGLEVYRTILQVLQGIAWALLVFFVVALIAFVLVKRGEAQRERGAS